MAKSDHHNLVELFRDRGIDFDTSNGQIQINGAELRFDATERLVGVWPEEGDPDDDEAPPTDYEEIKAMLKRQSIPYESVGKLQIRTRGAIFNFKPDGDLDGFGHRGD